MKKLLSPILLFPILLIATTLSAQTAPTPACPPTVTLDQLIAAINSSVSGPADQDRTCFRDIFYPEARLIPIGKVPEGKPNAGSFQPHIMTVDDWINAVAKRGHAILSEKQIKVETTTWANEVHLWSTYDLGIDGKPAARGINSIQAINDGTRWRIIQIVWQAEDAANPVPAKFLP